ncbi:hypothetical protein PG984_015359 [Apiospora sp. TS-2023a]
MDSLHWDTLGYAESDEERADSDSASDSEQEDDYPVVQTEPSQQQQQYGWQDLAWDLGTLWAECYIQERVRRRMRADYEGHRASKALAGAPCYYCGSLPRSCDRIDASRRHHRDSQESYCCCNSRELPQGPIYPTSHPISATPRIHELPADAQPLDKERKRATSEAPFVDKSLLAGRKDAMRDETPTSSPALERTPIIAQSLATDEKEVVHRKPPPSLDVKVPRYTLGLLSPIRLVSAFCIITGTPVFLNTIGFRSPWKGSCLGVFLAGGFAYHDVLLGELGWTTCGLNAILRWM